MSRADIFQFEQRLEYLFGRVKSLGHDPEVQSHWACYLCILVSGYLEVAVRIILSDYVRKCANVTVTSYVQSCLDGFQNPKMAKILDLVGCFSDDWRKALEADTTGALKDHIDSIVSNRNNLAHGYQVGVTYSSVNTWYGSAKRVVELLRTQCSS